jgi:hypothetical protein
VVTYNSASGALQDGSKDVAETVDGSGTGCSCAGSAHQLGPCSPDGYEKLTAVEKALRSCVAFQFVECQYIVY